MPFEFDPAKSRSNREKHGIDFHSAQALWDDLNLILAAAKTVDEPRFIAIGKIGGTHWSAIFTLRDNNVRIISVRRARNEEIERYEVQSLR